MVELSKLFSQTLRTTLSEQQQNQNASNNSSEQTSEESSPWKNIFTEVEIDTLRNKLGESKVTLTSCFLSITVYSVHTNECMLSKELCYYVIYGDSPYIIGT